MLLVFFFFFFFFFGKSKEATQVHTYSPKESNQGIQAKDKNDHHYKESTNSTYWIPPKDKT